MKTAQKEHTRAAYLTPDLDLLLLEVLRARVLLLPLALALLDALQIRHCVEPADEHVKWFVAQSRDQKSHLSSVGALLLDGWDTMSGAKGDGAKNAGAEDLLKVRM